MFGNSLGNKKHKKPYNVMENVNVGGGYTQATRLTHWINNCSKELVEPQSEEKCFQLRQGLLPPRGSDPPIITGVRKGSVLELKFHFGVSVGF